MYVYRFVLLLGLILAPLQALAADDIVASVPKDAVDAPVETMGTVIGTIGYRVDKTPKVGDAAFFFRRTGSQEYGYAHVSRGWLGIDKNAGALKDGKFRYAAFKMQLPEGRYEIARVAGSYDLPGCVAGNSPTRFANEKDFSVPFEVKRGKTLYLGSFLAHGTLEKGRACFIPIPVPSTVYFSYANKWQRDAQVFSQGQWAVDPTLVDHVNLAVNEHTDYYIIAEDHVPEKPRMRDYTAGKLSHAGKVAEYKAAHGDASAAESTGPAESAGTAAQSAPGSVEYARPGGDLPPP
jgi:hypothetical protein